jgi:hypothetical protein
MSNIVKNESGNIQHPKPKAISVSQDVDVSGVETEKAFAPLAKAKASAPLSAAEFQAPQSPEIDIQRQQREAAQGSQEYAQGVTAAHAIASTQAYKFKQGYADGLNEAMPVVGQDVASFVEDGERAVSNFFSDFTAQIQGK